MKTIHLYTKGYQPVWLKIFRRSDTGKPNCNFEDDVNQGIFKKLVEKIKDIILTTSPITITGTLSALAQRAEMCSTLNEILIPVLILCGEEDTITPMSKSEFLNHNIANSQLHSIDKAGHLSNLEQPDEFNRYLIPFIKQK